MKYNGRRTTERYVFLFDGLIILTKQNTKRSSVTGPVGDYKLKEKYAMSKVDIQDKEDTDGNVYLYLKREIFENLKTDRSWRIIHQRKA